MEERDCAFQYAKMESGYFRNTKIVCDKSELTINEAKQLWNEYFSDCAKWIKEGNTAEMVIWVDMPTPQSFGNHSQYISTDAESDGVSIWVTKKEYFTKQFDVAAAAD
jgi:hypothetical protein